MVCAAVSASPCELPRLLPPPSESAGPVAAALAVAAAASALSSSRLATPPLAHSPRQQVLVAAAWRLAREAEAERREEIELDARRLADEVSASKRRQEQAAAAVEAEADAQEQETIADEPMEAAGPREITIDRTTENGRNYITVDAAGSDQIELSFTDECWVEVNDTLHGLVYQDLRRVGDVLTVYGSAPFEVLLGKASGVQMIYNGRPVDLEPYTGRDRTAKLTIGE